MPSPPPQTFHHLITTFTTFLTIALHTILYERALYPPTTFLSAQKYNLPVRQNRHPRVCEWITDAVAAVETELLRGTVDRVAMVIYTQHNKPRERFVFDVSRFPAVPAGERDVPLQREGAGFPGVDLEEQFRATMGRLAHCGAGLGVLPEGCTFTVAVELKGGGGRAPVGHPQPWVPAEGKVGEGGKLGGNRNRTVPVRSVVAEEMVFETWIEEVGERTDDEETPDDGLG